MNRLANEKSPYLKQHADNPVDWYAWGDEAFVKARTENKPIFLSIGYSTCHWCHVMAHESFENPGIAKVLNEFFVSIKVDREERPDIDAVYMKAVMSLTGQGGWPLSAFLLPDGKPFYGGTYFPPEDRWGRPGFMTVLRTLNQKWNHERDVLLKAGNHLTQILNSPQTQGAVSDHTKIDGLHWATQAYERMLQSFDAEDGGFGGAPKFPRTHALDLLLAQYRRTKDAGALEMVEKTLQAMAAGGIRDHLGGGFHRYSVDAYWHVPHFEKMLYDQALIVKTYLEVFAITRNNFYAEIARSILVYVNRDLISPEGGFYSAEDADSFPPENSSHEPRSTNHEKKEGAFYVWSEAEIRAVLTAEEAELFCWAYGVQPNGNVKQDPHEEFTGMNVVFQAYAPNDLAARFQKTPHACELTLNSAKRKLFGAQKKRPRPHRDEKVMTDWNALMISSFALAGRILNEPCWVEVAERATLFLKSKLRSKNGQLLHRYAEEESAIPAFLEDYAFLANAMAELYQATFKIEYLKEAYFLCEEMIRLFYDSAQGGFLLSSFSGASPQSGMVPSLQNSFNLIAKTKELYDGAIPSGNGAAIQILIKLGMLFGKSEWIQAAEKTAAFFYAMLERDASAFPLTVMGLNQISELREVFVTGEENHAETQAMLGLSKQWIAGSLWVFEPVGADSQKAEALTWLDQFLPASKERVSEDGNPVAFVCQNQSCFAPVDKAQALEQYLR